MCTFLTDTVRHDAGPTQNHVSAVHSSHANEYANDQADKRDTRTKVGGAASFTVRRPTYCRRTENTT